MAIMRTYYAPDMTPAERREFGELLARNGYGWDSDKNCYYAYDRWYRRRMMEVSNYHYYIKQIREYRRCDECGEWYLPSGHGYSDRYCSEDCAVESGDYLYCEQCGSLERSDYGEWVDDEFYCSSGCVEDAGYRWCEYCGEWEYADECEYVVDYGYVCEYGRTQSNFEYCEHCGNWFHGDDFDFDRGCCYNCADECGDTIGGYHDHKGTYRTVKYGDSDKNIGTEIEVERKDSDYSTDEMASILDGQYNPDWQRPHIVFERDGSLSDGFEIISTPHSMDEFYKFDWAGVFNELSSKGYRSHDTSTCGLHLHFSRTWFGKTLRSQELGIRRTIALYEVFYNEFVKASRREEKKASDWAKSYGLYWGQGLDTLYELTAGALDTWKYGRYRAVNLCNNATVEFRLGRGTLKVESFNAWVDLHATICRNCHRVKNNELDNLDKWFDGIKPETVDYLESREAFMGFVNNYKTNKMEGVM